MKAGAVRDIDTREVQVDGAPPSLTRPITIAYVWNQRIYRAGGRYYAGIPNILDLMEAIGRYAGTIVACAPMLEVETPPEDTEPIPPSVEVFPLPFYAGNVDLILRSPVLLARLVRCLRPALRRWDAVGADTPSGMGLAAVLVALAAGRSGFLYARGFIMRMLRAEHHQLTLRGALVLGAFWPVDILARAVSHAGVLTFGLGPELADRYRGPRLISVRGYARPAIAGPTPPPPVQDATQLRRIGFVGRLSGEKGVDVLLRAFARLAGEEPEATLTIVGDGPDAAYLRALTLELKLESRVSFLGSVADTDRLRALYLEAGIIVVPSRTDGVAVVMMEALALGRAVIATRAGGNPTVLSDERNGLLIDIDDEDGLVEAIRRLWRDPELAFRIARGGQEAAGALTLEAQARTMATAVRALVAERENGR